MGRKIGTCPSSHKQKSHADGESTTIIRKLKMLKRNIKNMNFVIRELKVAHGAEKIHQLNAA